MRTGDLGFGEGIFVTGRLKELLIIRGRNHYPQDIRKNSRQQPRRVHTDAGAALPLNRWRRRSSSIHEVKRSHRRAEITEVAPILRQAVAETHDLQLYGVILVQPRAIPKTSSGKIQREPNRRFVSGRNIKFIFWRRCSRIHG